VDDVRVSGDTGAAGVLLITSGADHDRVLHGSEARGVKRPHVEDIDALHLSEDLETLHTGGLLDVGRDGTGGGTGTDKVIDGLDVCSAMLDLVTYIPSSILPIAIRSINWTRDLVEWVRASYP
jgi:hypothetical protein